MKQKREPREIWAEYEKGSNYNSSINLYETVQQCEDFYVGDQWKGCEGIDLDKPVMNILKRVVSFFIASIVSDDIGIHMETFDGAEQHKAVLDMLDDELGKILENARLRQHFRTLLRNAAVDGDGCLHYWFDPEAETGRPAGGIEPTGGAIKAEVLENYNVFFGNPQSQEVQGQPYIIVRYRRLLGEAKEIARANGAADWDSIQPDSGEEGVNTDQEQGKVTVLRKYWKEEGTVRFTEVCKQCVLRPEADTGYKLYPLVWMPWEAVKNQYHGQSAIKCMIPNQIFINKLYAMAMRHVQMCAFPKVVYNRAMLPGGWTNRVGEAIPSNGDPNMAVGQGIRLPDMSAQVLQMISQVAQDTRDTLGASDASLGNIKPDNTSAIIATQKATAMPLELQRMSFYDIVEESVRIWLEMMRCNYGLRYVMMEQPAPEVPGIAAFKLGGPVAEPVKRPVLFDFGQLGELQLQLNVEIGAASYWSELMQVQTIDGLFANGILSDPEVYLESIPDGYIKNKAQIIKSVKDRKEQEAMAARMAAMAPAGGMPV